MPICALEMECGWAFCRFMARPRESRETYQKTMRSFATKPDLSLYQRMDYTPRLLAMTGIGLLHGRSMSVRLVFMAWLMGCLDSGMSFTGMSC